MQHARSLFGAAVCAATASVAAATAMAGVSPADLAAPVPDAWQRLGAQSLNLRPHSQPRPARRPLWLRRASPFRRSRRPRRKVAPARRVGGGRPDAPARHRVAGAAHLRIGRPQRAVDARTIRGSPEAKAWVRELSVLQIELAHRLLCLSAVCARLECCGDSDTGPPAHSLDVATSHTLLHEVPLRATEGVFQVYCACSHRAGRSRSSTFRHARS